MVDSTLAFDILARDRASSAFDKVARAADKTSAALKRSAKISDDVARAETRLSKARDSESDSMGRVRVAELRLKELRDKGLQGTARFTAAEESLSSARRKAAQASSTAVLAEKSLAGARAKLAAASAEAGKDAGADFGRGFSEEAEKEGAKSGKRFGAGLKRWLTGSGADLGREGGTVFGSGFLGALKTPILGPAIIAVIGGAVAVAAPAVGAIAASGLVAGFGAGLVGLGLVFAAKSEAVKSAWRKSLADMGAQTRILSAPFEKTLISMAGFAQRTFAKFAPELQKSFSKLAPTVTAFADDAARALEKLAPAVGPITAAFDAVLKSLGPALQDAVGSLASGLIKLSASVKQNPTGLADLTRGAGDLVEQLLGMISTLNDADAAMRKLTGASGVTMFFKGIQGLVAATVGPILAMAKGITELSAAMNALQHSSSASGQSMSDAANKTVQLAQGLRTAGDGSAQAGARLSGMAAAAGHAAHETHKANVAAYLLATAFDRQSAATQRSIDLLNRRSSLLLALSGSEIAYQQAVDDASASIKENGRTHDINTQKGRDNQRALDQVAASATAQRDAMLKANDGNLAAARSATASRATYVKLAMQMGYNKATAQAMAAQFIAIPNVTRTARLKGNIADLDAKLKTARGKLDDKGLTKDRKARLLAEIANLEAGIRKAKGDLASVPASKTVTITTRLVTERISRNVSGATGGHVPVEKRAAGGPVTKGQPYIVGEKRPELFVPDQSGVILPKVPAAAMGSSVAAGMASGIRGGASGAIAAAGDIANAVLTKARSVLQISSPSKAFAQIGLYVNQGFSQGLRGSARSVQAVMASLMSKVLNISYNAAETKAAAQKQVATYTAQVKAATTVAARRAAQTRLRQAKLDLANVGSIANRLGTTPKRNAILAMLQRENQMMQVLANKRAAVATQLKAAQSRLAAAIQIRDEFRKSITDSALAFNAITNINSDDGQALTGEGLIARMQNTLARTKEFAANLARLKKMGLRGDLYKQIAEAGVEGGSATAQALLQNGNNTVAWANNLQSQIASASAGLGNTAASNMYQAGVDAAQGLVNGLLAKTKALDLASKKLADAIVAQIKKTLGIRSPSRVLMGLGSMTGQGFAAGIAGEYGNVARASAGLGDAAQNTGTQRRAGGGRYLGQQTTASDQPLIVQLVLDGRVIQQSLLRLKRGNGGGELGIA